MPTGTIAPFPFHQLLDNNGKNAAGYQLFTYEAGTTTKLSTYQEAAMDNAHTNPIVMDSSGRPPAPIFLQAKSYKFVFAPPTDSDPPTSAIWTADNVSATPAFDVPLTVSGTSAEAIAVADCVFLSDGSNSLTAGRWYKTDADFDYKSTLPTMVGFALTEATAAAQTLTICLGGAVVTDTAIYTAGADYFISATAGAITTTAPSNARRVAQAYSTIAFIVAADIEEPLLGHIDLPLESWREIAANEIGNTAAIGGLLTSDSTPALIRINTSTDKGIRIAWVAGNSDEITQRFTYPPDLDDGNPIIFNMRAAMSGATNTPTVQVDFFEGIGDTNAGGATAAVTGTSLATYTRTIAAADVGAYPNFASISLTPGAHPADAVRVYSTWITYTKKLKS